MRQERWTKGRVMEQLREWVAKGRTVVGIDEAGRGPLAGPVVAAAILLPPAPSPLHDLLFTEPPLLQDSKKLTPQEREQAVRWLKRCGACFAVGKASPAEIDRLNIRRATLLAMRRAVQRLQHKTVGCSIDLALVDGDALGDLGVEAVFVIDGDEVCPLISAASIIAKVARDRVMVAYDRRYPHYGFAQHKGYPTRQHLEALRRFGPCPIHRRSFAPMRIHADDRP
ncbi:Ribonuclease HII [bacterium HR17]|uniref:Ribonuclease HII n=1 Tax=Candidatus Fervidibacter japonicus TaxID=2035412 RepID=A0A2H5XAK1_9BACT|nr:Ribonuclease HII [bacterium HR17]